MKIYISADMEGIAGITHWDETDKGHEDYPVFSEQMTREVVAACEGTLEAGVEEIWIKDAHETGRNIIISELPKEAVLIRGWSGHPFSMVQELDETFAALMLIGYHAPAGSNGDPLAHTISRKVSTLKINGDLFSEFGLVAYTSALVGVPLVFVSGDHYTCREAVDLIPGVETATIKNGVGDSIISMVPEAANEKIKEGVKSGLRSFRDLTMPSLPDHFYVEVNYMDHIAAFRNSFYPGAELHAPSLIAYKARDFLEVLSFLSFVVG